MAMIATMIITPMGVMTILVVNPVQHAVMSILEIIGQSVLPKILKIMHVTLPGSLTTSHVFQKNYVVNKVNPYVIIIVLSDHTVYQVPVRAIQKVPQNRALAQILKLLTALHQQNRVHPVQITVIHLNPHLKGTPDVDTQL
jgi:hypothetical protein